ncbi:MAG: DUF2231 domain-containing protein [Candidatus Eremiobacteraeota bacterium]|nr:DUF2231 domain-containing protein [Candidatus Eremiobacteraeota bacterium]
MQGKATIAGHPLHPIFVTFPIGCFVAAVICDIISIWQGPVFWAEMSTWLLLFGIAGALVAAFFGFVDYLSAPMSLRAKSIAAWHMTLNIAAVVIFGVACALRFLDHASPAGHALTGLGIVVLAFSGVLGGSVAHGHLVGSSEQDVGTSRQAADQSAMTPRERMVREEINTPSASTR